MTLGSDRGSNFGKVPVSAGGLSFTYRIERKRSFRRYPRLNCQNCTYN